MTADPSPAPPELPSAISGLVEQLAAIPHVAAIALGGSRGAGTAGPDSDWDLGVYYDDGFAPQQVRALGHHGTVTELGEWGGGVFDGGAWLEVEGTKVDLLWRSTAVVQHEIAEAREGRWRIEPLMFHLTGIPTYLLLAELAQNRVLVGRLPRTEYPLRLRDEAGRGWAERAELTLGYAADAHARHGRVTAALGLLAVGAAEYAHAIAATRGVWVTNDKTLLALGGLDGVDAIVASLPSDAGAELLTDTVARVRDLGRRQLASARAGS